MRRVLAFLIFLIGTKLALEDLREITISGCARYVVHFEKVPTCGTAAYFHAAAWIGAGLAFGLILALSGKARSGNQGA